MEERLIGQEESIEFTPEQVSRFDKYILGTKIVSVSARNGDYQEEHSYLVWIDTDNIITKVEHFEGIYLNRSYMVKHLTKEGMHVKLCEALACEPERTAARWKFKEEQRKIRLANLDTDDDTERGGSANNRVLGKPWWMFWRKQ